LSQIFVFFFFWIFFFSFFFKFRKETKKNSIKIMQLTYRQHSLTFVILNHISFWILLNWVLFQLDNLRLNTNFTLTTTNCSVHVCHDRIEWF